MDKLNDTMISIMTSSFFLFRALSEEEIESLATCQQDLPGDLIAWDPNRGWETHGEVTFRDEELHSMCKQEERLVCGIHDNYEYYSIRSR